MTSVHPIHRASYALRRVFRRFYGHPVFVFLLRLYFRHILGLLRLFSPLFGATAVFSVTYRCQCSCVHCGAGLFRKDAQRELTPEEVRAFIDDLARLGASGIHFFGGEPLVAPGIVDYVRHAKAKGLFASLDSNGLRLDEAMVLELQGAGIDLLRVSIDSPDAATHDRLRGVAGTFEKALEALRACVRHGVPCFMSLYATRENLADGTLRRSIALARSIGARVRILSAIQTGKWIGREGIGLSGAELKELRSLLDPDWVCWETEFLNSAEVPFWCNSMIRNKFDVSAYGDVMACCYMPLTFGNIREEPLEKVVHRMWRSELFASHQEHFDCPMNDPRFMERYGEKLRAAGGCGARGE
ncbi:MAG: radical SAM protein [Elusimicrobiota bacterium]|jgi:MoaA/NifB/PqqE/SkfB family radical SAM enzyme